MSDLVLDHLWQSTLFAAVAGLLTLALRRNGARLRHHLWFAASVKFLVPFAALMALGRLLPAAPVAPAGMIVMRHLTMPFSAQPMLEAPMQPMMDWTQMLPSLLLALWAIGFIAITARWLLRWSRLQRVVRQAVDCPLPAPVPVKMAPSLLEPGLVGIVRPVILLPEGIERRLSQREMDAVLAHEICHLHRRDNLTAAAHMLVEALFWFHPLVWWLGARLNAEREQACDESVLAAGQSPEVYATSILKVCQFYLHSPLDCAAGISGADLKTRMETIMQNNIALPLNAAKKILLAGAAAAAIAAPLVVGVVTAPVFAQTSKSPGSENGSAFFSYDVRKPDACDGKAPPQRCGPKAPPPRTIRDPRSEAALRGQIEGWQKHGPAIDALSPQMARFIGKGRDMMQKKFDSLGALKSLTFKGVEESRDYYLAEFANGRQSAAINLNPEGKITLLEFGKAVVRTNPNGPEPGTEAVLRRFIGGLVTGHPDYDDLSPLMVAVDRKDGMGGLANSVRPLGALKSLTFQKVSAEGLDRFDAVFANGHATWTVGPLVNGKLVNFGYATADKKNPNLILELRLRDGD